MIIKMNGIETAVSGNQTLLDALRENGVDVPGLCHMKELLPCGACGLCLVEIAGAAKLARACATMPREGMAVLTDTPRVRAARQNTLALLLSDHRGDCLAPCTLRCPAHQDVQGYIGLIANGHTDEALRRILNDNPLPACIGRVCPHPCEGECRRAKIDEPLSIMHLKRFAADSADAQIEISRAADTGKRAAIVGAGPAGLSCAYFLARAGIQATIYESMPAPGGMLRYGIPAYRLAKDVLSREIRRIEGLGVKILCGKRLGRDITLDTLQNDYDAVFIAAGAWQSATLGCEGETLPGVLGGIDFLRAVAMGDQPPIGRRVAVVGGGNTAMDAVRTAVRLGAKEVTLLYRRTREEMPAEADEIQAAMDEGVRFCFLSAPERVLEKNGRAAGLRISKMALGEPDASGRRRPVPTGESEDLLFDTVIAAIGQKVDAFGLDALDKTRRGTVTADPDSLRTNIPGVFAGGDMVNDGPGIAISAIAHGKRAALAIACALNGLELPEKEPFVVKQKDVPAALLPDVPKDARQTPDTVPACERKHTFDEYEAAFTPEQARKEASRCLECGCGAVQDCKLLPLLRAYKAYDIALPGEAPAHKKDASHPFIVRDPNKCVLCGLCVRVCDEIKGARALGFSGRGLDTLAAPPFDEGLMESNCISCGLCADACPTGALLTRLPGHKTPPLPMQQKETTCAYCPRGCKFILENYGGCTLRAVPVKAGESCSIGRWAPLLPDNAKANPAVSQAMAGDLSAFIGELPDTIKGIPIKPSR